MDGGTHNPFVMALDEFWIACEQGDLENAKRLFRNGGINIHALRDRAFRHACANGQLHVAKWLHELGGVRIHSKDNAAFRGAFANGHAETVQWLHGLGINVHVLGRDRFNRACQAGHLQVAQWLYGLGGVDKLDRGLHDACMLNHVNVVKWLWLLGHPSIMHISLQRMFERACEWCNLELMQWLHGLGDIDIHRDGDRMFRMACRRVRLDMARWLMSLEPHYVWRAECFDRLTTWSRPRDAWMRSVVRGANVRLLPVTAQMPFGK